MSECRQANGSSYVCRGVEHGDHDSFASLAIYSPRMTATQHNLLKNAVGPLAGRKVVTTAVLTRIGKSIRFASWY